MPIFQAQIVISGRKKHNIILYHGVTSGRCDNDIGGL